MTTKRRRRKRKSSYWEYLAFFDVGRVADFVLYSRDGYTIQRKDEDNYTL